LLAVAFAFYGEEEILVISTGWPKKLSHYQMIKNHIESYLSLSVRLDLFVN